MKKIILLLFVVMTLPQISKSQSTADCGTLDTDSATFYSRPWIGNNAFLEHFLDSIGYPKANSAARIIGNDRVKIRIPIKFWVYRRSNSTGGANLLQLKAYIDNLNRFYNVENNTWIGFYMACEPAFIDDDEHFNIEKDSEAREMNRNHRDDGCINVHIANSLPADPGKVTHGVRYAPVFHGSFIFLGSGTYNNPNLIGVLSHEIGHYFTLDHTHKGCDGNTCNQEPVDRYRTYPMFNLCISSWFSGKRICEVAGDGLGDTPADPDLSNNLSCVFNSGTTFYTNKQDNWGDNYFRTIPTTQYPIPETRNLMNYNGDRSCRNLFSRLQIAQMLYDATTSRHADFWQNTSNQYDNFEPDNLPEMANNIRIGEVQERSFNRTYVEDRSFGNSNKYFVDCDIDWVSFTPNCSRDLIIETYEMPNRPQANTRITLFDTDGRTQLAQNDDISATNHFSSLTFNFIAGHQYFIRVENMEQNGTTTFYKLAAGGRTGDAEIIGDIDICTSKQYTINNLNLQLPNTSVSWQISPSYASISCSPCNVTTLTKQATGIATIKATITHVCFNQPYEFTKQVVVGTPPPITTATLMSKAGEPTDYMFTTEPNFPASLKYNWFVNNVQKQSSSLNEFDWYFPCKVTKTIKCNISNTCGVSPFSTSYTYKGDCIRAQAHRFAINRNLTTANLLTIKVAQLSEDLLHKYYFGEVPLANEQVVHVRVYNKEGALLQETDGTGGSQLDLDISNYAEGTYNIEVTGQGDYRELQTYYLTGLSATEGSIAEAIATGSVIISDIQHDARLYVMQQNLYYNLQYDQAFMNSSSILTDFSHTTGQGSFGAMFRIDEALYNGDYAAAQDLLNNFTTTNAVDENYKAYYELYLRYINADAFDADDLSDLYAIAEKCPLTDGEIVYAARSLYNLLSQSTETFTYACGGIGLRMANQNSVQSQQPTLIYPNPSNGQFTVTFTPTKKGFNTVAVFDAFGKQVAAQSISANVGKINLNLKLATGLYIVKTTNTSTGKTETQKLIIQ